MLAEPDGLDGAGKCRLAQDTPLFPTGRQPSIYFEVLQEKKIDAAAHDRA